jgi:tetratricopeptide (TPR) repeat protein
VAEGARQVRIFVSSPGDARFERRRLERVTERLNGEFQGTARIIVIRWETEFYKAHDTFQAQIPEAAECDIVLAIFRSRLGTELPPDFPRMASGEPYPSGTAYEVLSAIVSARARGLPDVYVFRYPQPPSVQLDDPERTEIETQWERLKQFFETWFRAQSGQFKAAFQSFASTDDFEAQAESLLRKWLEEKVLHGRTVVWPVEIKGSPFCGLASFGTKHAPVFFGRGRDIATAVDRLKDGAEKGCPFLLVDGASGAGKSSLVRAGLVPRLTAAGVVSNVDVWRVAVMRPGEVSGDPFAALARALFMRRDDLPDYEQGRPPALPELSGSDFPNPEDLSAQLAHADASALKPIITALAAVAQAERQGGGYEREVNASLLLVVDQLDELFALHEGVRARFAKLLAHLARSKRVWIIATLRADLFDRFLSEPVLKQLKGDGASFDLAPPNAAELVEIVRGPSTAAGLTYEQDPASGETLDGRLFKDAERPDLLPLLQFTLNQLFAAAKQTENPTLLTFAAYRSLGGLEGAVDREAEAAIQKLDEAQRARLPRLLRELAAPARDGDVTEARNLFDIRPVPLAKAAYDETSAQLVRALVDARILLSSGEGKNATLRLAHARVLDAWQSAKKIVEENADFYRIRANVEEQHKKWEKAKRSRDLLIARGRPVAEAESIVRRFPDEIPAATRDFIERSGRRARLAQTLAAAAAVLFAVVASAAMYAAWLAVRAQREAELNYRLALDQAAGSVGSLNQGFIEGAINTRLMSQLVARSQATVNKLPGASVQVTAARIRLLIAMSPAMIAVGEMNNARDYADAATKLADQLIKREPNSSEWHLLRAEAINAFGIELFWDGNSDDGRKQIQTAIDEFKQLSGSSLPSDEIDAKLMSSYENLGDAARSMGDFDGATAAYKDWLSRAETLAAKTADRVRADFWLSYAADAHLRLGDMLAQQHKFADAATEYQSGLTIASRLTSDQPDNTKYLEHLSLGHGKLGDSLISSGDLGNAAREIDSNIDLSDSLVRDTNIRWLIYQEWAHLRKGRLLMALSRYDDAFKEFSIYLEDAQAMRRHDPGYFSALYDEANARQWMGDTMRLQNKLDLAAQQYHESLSVALVLKDLSPSTNQAHRKILAMAYFRLGLVDELSGQAAQAATEYKNCLDVSVNPASWTPRSIWPEDVNASCGEHVAKLGNTAPK